MEHRGILAFAAGIGGAGLWAALFHTVNHTFAKGALFLVAGNILFRYHTRSTLLVAGVRRGMPLNGALWLAGILAICGLPPFGVFLSEFAVAIASFGSGREWEGALYLAFLAVAFIGILTAALGMLRGAPPPSGGDGEPESVGMALPPLLAMAAVLALGLGVPDFLAAAIGQAAAVVGPAFTSMPGMSP